MRPTPSTLAQSKERKGSNFAIWQPWPQGARWRCEYCTYDNWSKTSRCAMCKAARAIRVIADAAADDAAEDGSVAAEIDCDAAAEKNNNSRNASSTDIYSLSGAASSTSAWNYDQVRK